MTSTYETLLAARGRWAVALAELPRSTVLETATELAQRHQVTPTAVPQSGLTLVTLRDSVEKQAFYLGEAPLASSQVALTDSTGRTVAGGALILADDTELANALAICDGVLAGRLDGWEEVATQVEIGLERISHEQRVRKTMLSRSRVSFALLNEEDTEESNELG